MRLVVRSNRVRGKNQISPLAGSGLFVAVYLQICDKILTTDFGITEDF